MNKTSWRKILRQVFEAKIAFQKFSNLISLLSMNLNKKKQNQCFQIIFHQILKKYFWETSKRFSVAFFLLQKVFVLLSKKMKKDSPFAKVKHLTLDIKVCFFKCQPKSSFATFQQAPFLVPELSTISLLPWNLSFKGVGQHRLSALRVRPGVDQKAAIHLRLEPYSSHIKSILRMMDLKLEVFKVFRICIALITGTLSCFAKKSFLLKESDS